MDAEKQRAIARKGGQSVSPQDRSFSRNHELAAEAGRKGGRSVSPQDRSFARDPGLAAEAGRKGGERSGSGRGIADAESEAASESASTMSEAG